MLKSSYAFSSEKMSNIWGTGTAPETLNASPEMASNNAETYPMTNFSLSYSS